MSSDHNSCGIDPSLDIYRAGQTVAQFLPADPAVWFEASSANGYYAWADDNGMGFWLAGVPKQAVLFFNGWLHATPGGDVALARYLRDRGIKDIPREFLA